MQCDVCNRSASSALPFNCTICARDILYRPRLKHVQLLLEKESVEEQVEQSISGDWKPSTSSSSPSSKKQEVNAAWTIRRASADQTSSEEQAKTIHSHIQKLRQETENMKADIASRKVRLLQRRSELVSAQKEHSHSQASSQEPFEKSIRRTTHRWDNLHTKTAESRLYLCKEAAHLYGLQHQKRKKGVRGRDVYTIGGVPIVDLRDLNNASPSEVTVSTSHVAHLVHLSSYYLSLKLPAEITLPHKDYPSPTIFSPSSSYTATRPVPFPGTTPSHSPEASRHKDHTSVNTNHNASNNSDTRPLPRPRMLHLSKPLATLAKDDPVAYANFVEAITFLAWDIAWLCRTQGLPVGHSSWEDICAMGRNLYHLLLAPSSSSLSAPRPPLPSSSAGKFPPSAIPLHFQQPYHKPTPSSTNPPAPPPGHFSHATTYAFLGTAAGNEYMRSTPSTNSSSTATSGASSSAWRLASAVKAVERVKGMLLAERMGNEWEMLEGEMLEDEEGEGKGVGDGAVGKEQDAQEVGVGEKGGGLGMGRTGVLVRRVDAGGDGVGGDKATGGGAVGERDRERGSGWMKVKSRSSGSGAGEDGGT